ncbi:MAG: 5-formyltetrahydrofolate cyclo-ligase [Dongiaceae bacterium]
MYEWAEIRSWRKSQRAQLLSRRVATPQAERARLRSEIMPHLTSILSRAAHGIVGFYWPFKGEVDLRGVARLLIDQGFRTALPVVVEKNRPLEFWEWRPRMPMSRGIWDIPVPAERTLLQPTLVFAPLVGFDGANYRLGYGGGYYDRTLAAMPARPFVVGVGYEFSRLATIHPQPHDIAMDVIVTEAGLQSQPTLAAALPPSQVPTIDAPDDDRLGSFSSPPCMMHELADDWSYERQQNADGPKFHHESPQPERDEADVQRNLSKRDSGSGSPAPRSGTRHP